MNEENTISRRKVIGGLGAGLAAAVIAPVTSAQGAPNAAGADPENWWIQRQSIRSRLSKVSLSHGRALHLKWTRSQIMAKTATRVLVVWQDVKH